MRFETCRRSVLRRLVLLPQRSKEREDPLLRCLLKQED